ncbi:MAG: hypothetical protein U5J62_03460 [Desulfurivibrio sp.]|nr:hypothetical protein [Desulfurivibrio sp.]
MVHLYKEIAAPGLEGHGLWQKARRNPRTTFARYEQATQLRLAADEQGAGVALTDGRRFKAEEGGHLCPAIMPGMTVPPWPGCWISLCDQYGFLAPLHSRLEAGRSSARASIRLAARQGPA